MSNSPIHQVANLISKSQYLEAESVLWDLLSKSKKDFILLKTLGLCLLLQSKNKGALKAYLDAYSLKSDDFDVVNNLSHLYLKYEEFQKSYELALNANEIDSTKSQPFITLLELDIRKRNFGDALAKITEITKRIDFNSLIKNPNVLYSILDVYVALKDNDELLKFLNYIHEKVFNPEVFYYHTTTLPDKLNQSIIDKAKEVLKFDGFKNPVERAKTISPILFGFAKYHESKKEMDISDNYYHLANSEVDKVQRYMPLQNQKLISRIKNVFQNNLDFFPKYNEDGLIFILGMPRSGTTLVESIIASASNTISGGELTSFHDLVSSKFDDSPEISIYEDPGEIYLNRIKFIRGKNRNFIDKLPGNYHTVGFINQIFPNAKIIYLKRDPWDTAISIYKQFYVSNIPYASTFFNIAVTYANHEEIMRFWCDECNVKFLTVEYENLVKDIENTSKKIYDFCSIDHVYNPEERKGHFARTASKNQVNKDVHTTSIGKVSFDDKKEDFLNFLNNQRKYWKKNLS
jgi:tetratricopeptide (TPR) repeat protein